MGSSFAAFCDSELIMIHRPSRVVRAVAICLSAAVGLSAAASLLHADEPIDVKPAKKPLGPGPNPDKKDRDIELIGPIKPTTRPTTGPAAKKEEKKKVEVAAEARTLLDSVRDAYAKLKTLRVEGTILGEIDMNGEQQTNHAQFNGTFQAPLTFRSQLREQVAAKPGETKLIDSMVVGGTGKKLYIFEPAYKYYYLADNPKERNNKEIGSQVGATLEQQNLSLLLAIQKDASEELLDNIDKVEKVEDTKIGDDSCPTLRFTVEKQVVQTVAFDPKTYLVRRVTWDRKGYAEAHKQQDIKKVLTTVDYAKTEIDPDLSTEAFAWTPPIGARDMTTTGGGADVDADDGADPDEAHAALIGKPAPDFKLKGLDGNDVKLADLKGQVVLLDFWATWCGPCRASLPHLDEIYQELKDKGLKAYAIDLRENEGPVKSFVENTKLGIPVLLDSDGKVAKSFGVGGIPQTVVIGKDGTIKKIVVGAGTHEQIKAAIEEALK
jgi:DsbE subfamily thiol:disulfide oxidoreductase